MILRRSPDINKARSLVSNANDILSSLKNTANPGARFLVLNYYAAIMDFIGALLSAEGVKLIDKDHHKAAIEWLSKQGPWSARDVAILDNVRIIRNDIQYYGTKSIRDIEEFLKMNQPDLVAVIEKFQKILEGKLS